MFPPSPVKSSSAAQPSPVRYSRPMHVAHRNGSGNDDHVSNNNENSKSAFVLTNSPHPILDGANNQGSRQNDVLGCNNNSRDRNQHEEMSGSKRQCAGNSQSSSKRAFYSTESEFIARDNNNANTISSEVKDVAQDEEIGKVKTEDPDPGQTPMNIANYESRAYGSHKSANANPHTKPSHGNITINSNDTNNNKDEHSGNETDNEDDDENQDIAEILTLQNYQPREPSYLKANAIPFLTLCKRFETLWKQRKASSRKKVTTAEKLAYLLPDKLFEYLEGGSAYPMLRLILPDHDSVRPHTGLKEAKLGQVYGEALGLSKNHTTHQKLMRYTDPAYTGPNSVGDISLVIQEVMEERYPSRGSKMTVGEVNDWLDVLVAIVKDRFGMATSDSADSSSWRLLLEREMGKLDSVGTTGPKKITKQQKYSKLVEKIIEKKLSPVEHKWIVRILLQKIEIGVGYRSIFGYFSPHAQELYDTFNNLKELCKRLSDPKYNELFRITKEQKTKEMLDFNREHYLPQSTLHPEVQKTISPMLSLRTSPDTFLTKIAHRHKSFAETLPAGSSAKTSLALQHPAFMCEIKMDGERMLVHIKRGIVTMQTRNNTWYSPAYSPALGPSLRAAISRYDVDVILDGEIIAYDSYENRPAPFGSNRSVAKMHRTRRRMDGTLDERDLNLHANESEINVLTIAKSEAWKRSNSGIEANDCPDDQYWLKYVIFDIIYVDGPDAVELLSKSSHLFPKNECIRPGSIINFDLMRRKSILYKLIQPQQNTVELIQSIVIRSDGSSMDSDLYFSENCNLEYGKTPCELDSINLVLNDESTTSTLNAQRLGGKKHEEIEIKRALSLEQYYHQIVETAAQEGLVFKDLASPYYLGSKSRSIGYWWKLKADYDASGQVSDIDVLVLGGSYARGMRKAGFLSNLLVGCTDDADFYGRPVKYMTLNRINFTRSLSEVMKITGFQKAYENNPVQLGKWFETSSSDSLPDFISMRSHQRCPMGDENGWDFAKKDFPDLWIRPEDSFVLTLNAGEIVESGSMAAGVALRFPRIKSIRAEGFDGGPKAPEEVQNVNELHQMFREKQEQGNESLSFGTDLNVHLSRFLTECQLERSGKQKPSKKSRKVTKEVKASHIPTVVDIQSLALDGFVFTVLEGNYCLGNDAFAAAEAEERGWAKEAKAVKCRQDVIKFIQTHGGRCQLSGNVGSEFVLGGMLTDARVTNYSVMLNNCTEVDYSKKNAPARRLLEIGGVVKWTFVYSIVWKFLNRLEEEKVNSGVSYDSLSIDNNSIKSHCPELAHPRRSDYLLMSPAAEKILTQREDSYGLSINETSNIIDFQRSLEEVGRQRIQQDDEPKSKQQTHPQKAKHLSMIPWQICAMKDFDEGQRWVFGGRAQKLWPYVKDLSDSSSSLVVMYPDLFSDLGCEDANDLKLEGDHQWNNISASKAVGSISSVLPLARAMGAIVTSHLHSGVTHILCELKRHKILEWSVTLSRAVYSNEESGIRLHDRLLSLEESGAGILLVSPDWVNEKWHDN